MFLRTCCSVNPEAPSRTFSDWHEEKACLGFIPCCPGFLKSRSALAMFRTQLLNAFPSFLTDPCDRQLNPVPPPWPFSALDLSLRFCRQEPSWQLKWTCSFPSQNKTGLMKRILLKTPETLLPPAKLSHCLTNVTLNESLCHLPPYKGVTGIMS